MSKQPFYNLRPNKSIDRSLFIQSLIGLSRVLPIPQYEYTGFGSYLFDDFKLIHDTLGVSKMVSLERDGVEYARACFNKPYNCIEIQNTSSSAYLSELDITDEKHGIFWLDYTSPSDLGAQLSDYATLLNKANANDIIRITLNANPDSLGRDPNPDTLQETRLKTLQKRVPSEYLFPDIKAEDVITKKYPLTLLKVLKAVTLESLTDDPPYSPGFFLPLFSCIYADGQQMLTFTGIVLDSHEKEQEIRQALSSQAHISFSWEDPCIIQIPHLTTREMTEINKLLPNETDQQKLIKEFPFIFSPQEIDAANSYISYYKYYPSYHKISF